MDLGVRRKWSWKTSRTTLRSTRRCTTDSTRAAATAASRCWLENCYVVICMRPTAAPRLLFGILYVRNLLRRQRGLTDVHQQGLSGTREQLQPDLPGTDEVESSRC